MLIGKDWKIEGDAYNVTVSHRRIIKTGKKAGQERWVAEGYYSTLQGALSGLVDARVHGTGLTDLKKVVDEIEAIKKDFGEVLGRIGIP